MRLSALFGCGIMMMALIVGCGGSSDEPMKESINIMNEMSVILESVKDEKSAKEVEPKIAALKTRMEAVDKKIKEMPKDKLEAMSKKYEAEGKAAAERMFKATMKAAMSGLGGMMPKFGN